MLIRLCFSFNCDIVNAYIKRTYKQLYWFFLLMCIFLFWHFKSSIHEDRIATWRVCRRLIGSATSCPTAPPSDWRVTTPLQPDVMLAECLRRYFRETQVLGQRPRAARPYRSSIITHQHCLVLSHFGHRPPDCAARLSPPLVCVQEAQTEVAGWQLFSRSSQWTSVFFCSCSLLSPSRAKTMWWRSCRWKSW